MFNKKIAIRVGAAAAVLGLGGWAVSSLFKGGGKVAATPNGGVKTGTGLTVSRTNSGQASSATATVTPPDNSPGMLSSVTGSLSSLFGGGSPIAVDANPGVDVGAAIASTGASPPVETSYSTDPTTSGAVQSAITGALNSVPGVGTALAWMGINTSAGQGIENTAVTDVTNAIDAVTGTMATDTTDSTGTSDAAATASLPGLGG